jgi:hypothetical protein
MIATEPLHEVQSSTLKISVGTSAAADPSRAILDASECARTGLRGATAHLALVVSAGPPASDGVSAVKSVFGPVGVAGGATTRIMTEAGFSERGAVVIAMATEGDATSGVASVSSTDAMEAGRSAARIIMAGWPFRLRYPRGLGVAFTGIGAPREFLESWRQFMGPKMRTLCGVMPGGALYGSGNRPVVSVACLEAPYATGLGYAEGFDPDGNPDADVLVHGAAEATATAIKRLNERSARLVLVLESSVRHAALGARAGDEWQQIVGAAGERLPCVGWLCDRVDGYGRGIQPADQPGALVVTAIGDAPAASA